MKASSRALVSTGFCAHLLKPPVSAARVRKKQNPTVGIGADVPSNHAAARHLKAADEAMQRTPSHCTWLYEEAGVYNFYLRTPQTAPREADDRGLARDLSFPTSAASTPWVLFVVGRPSRIFPRPQAGLRAQADSAQTPQVGSRAKGNRRRRVRAPRTPSAAEVQEHEDQGHAVCRSWCAVCGGPRGTFHKTRQKTGDKDPVVALDYAYLTKDGREAPDGGRAVATHDILTLLVVPEDAQGLCGNGGPAQQCGAQCRGLCCGLREGLGPPKARFAFRQRASRPEPQARNSQTVGRRGCRAGKPAVRSPRQRLRPGCSAVRLYSLWSPVWVPFPWRTHS